MAGPLQWVTGTALPDELSGSTGRLDAYLVWDLFTDFQRHADLLPPAAATQSTSDRWLTLVAELAAPPAEALDAMAADKSSGMAALAAALSRWAGPHGLSAIQTGIVPGALVPALAQAVSKGWLLRFQLGAPCAQPLAEALAPHPGRPAWLSPGTLHTLGMIDDGCCLAHQDFRTAQGHSRLLWLWDQTPDAAAGPHWARHAGAGDWGLKPAYGMELANQRIGALLQSPHTGRLGEAGERALYAAIGRPTWGPPDHTHGARVLHLLAGPAPLLPEPLPAAASAGAGPSVASLPLIFVQLPAQTIADTSGDSLAMHVIDGARYIVARTREAAEPGGDWRSTINISLGGIAGPHDGSSLAEQALDELAADARVQIVVSAGNAGGDQRIHAQRAVSAAEPGDFFIDLPGGQQQDSFVEFWLPDGGEAADGWTVTVQPPGQVAAAATVAAGQVACLRQDGRAIASVVFARQVAQGLHGTMVLLALAPTAAPPVPTGGTPRATAPPGVWQVQLQSRAAQPAEVHAWVERDDVLVGERQPQRTRFALDARQPRDAQYVNDCFTVSTLAHGQRVVAAGALVQATNAMAAYSSQGPRRGMAGALPLQFAPGDRSASQRGLLVPGFFSGQTAVIGGTSAAAPQVARRLVETGSAAAPDAASMTDPDGRPLPTNG